MLLLDLPQHANKRTLSAHKNNGTSAERQIDQRRQPPHNIGAEQSVLGIILHNNPAFDRVVGLLDAEHFFDPLHADIYEAASKLIKSGKHASPITLRALFEKYEPVSDALTAPQYLGVMVSSAVANGITAVNVADYARIIIEHADRRQLIQVSEDIAEGAYGAEVDFPPHRQIAEHRGRLGEMLARSAGVPHGSLADIEPTNIDWLWHRRIARGKVSLIAGQPGRGKSQLSLHFASLVSTGGYWPDGTACPSGSALIVSCEDDAADTIVPRLMAAGADRKRCYTHQLTDLTRDLPALEAHLRAIGDVALVIIDPVTAYLGKFDGNNAPEIRRLMAPLQKLAADLNVAVVLVTHLNKGTANGEPMSRVSGSGAFVAVCRSAWLVETDPEDSERRRRLLVPLKNNIGDDITGFAFKVEGAVVEGAIETSRVVFEPGTVTISAADILKGQQEGDEDVGALGDARDFLRDLLKEGAIASKAVQKAAEDAGIAKRTLARARKDLKVKATKSGATGNWLLSLPDPQGCQERQGCQEINAPDIGTVAVYRGLGTQQCQEPLPGNVGTLGTVGALDSSPSAGDDGLQF